jgi:hypothetical protein
MSGLPHIGFALGAIVRAKPHLSFIMAGMLQPFLDPHQTTH